MKRSDVKVSLPLTISFTIILHRMLLTNIQRSEKFTEKMTEARPLHVFFKLHFCVQVAYI